MHLVVRHFGHSRDDVGELIEHARRVLERSALRHVEHDLEFGLVVERQHLENYPSHCDQPDREHDCEYDRAVKPVTVTSGLLAAQKAPARSNSRCSVIAAAWPPRDPDACAKPKRKHERNRISACHVALIDIGLM
jgi:hypothetical protein